MSELPFNIPPSLFSYVEQYHSAPKKTTRRLENQLKKRGSDAVGFFLLAWFYFEQEEQEKAIDAAHKARMFAPGSLFFDKLHYFFSHPHLFEAWCSSASHAPASSIRPSFEGQNLSFDLDSLIRKLSSINTSRINWDDDRPSSGQKSNDKDASESIVSETLARIHEQQGKHKESIAMYERLKSQKPERSAQFEERIQEIKEKMG